MTPEQRAALRADVRAAVARKTPEEKRASILRLYTEIGENLAVALSESFEKVFRDMKEKEDAEIIAREAQRGEQP